MEESLKYFVPQIEDIRVGYECEYMQGNQFLPFKVRQPEISILAVETGILRTPYLTKEQIEAEGFIFSTWSRAGTGDKYIQGNYYCKQKDTQEGGYKIWIHTMESSSGRPITDLTIWKSYWNRDIGDYESEENSPRLFEGKCPSINEFRTIMKLLNIK